MCHTLHLSAVFSCVFREPCELACTHIHRDTEPLVGELALVIFWLGILYAKAAVHGQCVPSLCIVLLHLFSFALSMSFSFEGLSKHCCLQVVITLLHYYYVSDIWGSLSDFFPSDCESRKDPCVFHINLYLCDTNML